MDDARRSDLAVEPISDALMGWTIDVVVSGSIGAVESVRFIRALRRLGAEVIPWLTAGGARFVTDVSIGWAAGRPVRADFSGDASHIATHHACVIAPASANIISQITLGDTSTPAGALVTSYLGAGLPVCVVPNMHDSLALSPAIAEHMGTLRSRGVRFVASRDEEGKRKFPDPRWLADEVAHFLLRDKWKNLSGSILVSMGTTRGYLDDVRYISNYSSGALGSSVAEELHRQGFVTHVVAGPCPITPKNYGHITRVETNSEMAQACHSALTKGAKAAVLAASVLDFAPEAKIPGKIKSADTENLTVKLVRQDKIIAQIKPASGIKVGFKLEVGLSEERAVALAREYIRKYDLSLMVINDLSQVNESTHSAWLFERVKLDELEKSPQKVDGKAAVAQVIVRHICSHLKSS